MVRHSNALTASNNTRGNHRLKNAFDMRSVLFPGRLQIFTGFYELVSGEKQFKKQFYCQKVDIEQYVLHNYITRQLTTDHNKMKLVVT